MWFNNLTTPQKITVQASVMGSEIFFDYKLYFEICCNRSILGRWSFFPPKLQNENSTQHNICGLDFSHLFCRALQAVPPQTLEILFYWPSFCTEVQFSDAHQKAELSVFAVSPNWRAQSDESWSKHSEYLRTSMMPNQLFWSFSTLFFSPENSVWSLFFIHSAVFD